MTETGGVNHAGGRDAGEDDGGSGGRKASDGEPGMGGSPASGGDRSTGGVVAVDAGSVGDDAGEVEDASVDEDGGSNEDASVDEDGGSVDGADAAMPIGPPWPADCEELHVFTASGDSGPYVVPANTELAAEFPFEVPWTGSGPVQMLARRPVIDAQGVVHTGRLAGEFNGLIASFGPGSELVTATSEEGAYLPTSGQLKLVLHYDNLGNDEAVEDRSGVEICITRKPRPITSVPFPFVALVEPPANTMLEEGRACTVGLADPLQPTYLLSTTPYMHRFGVHTKLEVTRATGDVEVLYDDDYTTGVQPTIAFGMPIQLNDGDKVRTYCTLDNTSDTGVSIGDNNVYEASCAFFTQQYPPCSMFCGSARTVENLLAADYGGSCPSELRPVVSGTP